MTTAPGAPRSCRPPPSLIATSGLRTSLQEIADAAGILPAASITISNPRKRSSSSCSGAITPIWTASPSTRRAGWTTPPRGPRSIGSSISSSAIAQCAVTHGAALQMTFYEGPTSNPGTGRTRPAATDGDPGGDAADAAGREVERLPQARCRPAGPGRPHRPDDAAGRPRRHPLQRERRQAGRRCCAESCWRGLAAVPPTDAALDRSAAFIAADDVVKSWTDDSDAEPNDKAAHVRAVARAEFGRKGYEVTTIGTSRRRPDSAPARCTG